MRALFFVLGMLVAFGIVFWLIHEYYGLKQKLANERKSKPAGKSR